jgi:hypothetical protein
MSLQVGKSLGNKVVLAKIPREEFTRFKQYCDRNGETINASLRRLIASEIDNPKPERLAAQSVFEYNKHKDNFAWRIVSDGNLIFEIDGDLPASSVEQLFESLKKATDARKSFIRKNKKGSAPFPTRLIRKNGYNSSISRYKKVGQEEAGR